MRLARLSVPPPSRSSCSRRKPLARLTVPTPSPPQSRSLYAPACTRHKRPARLPEPRPPVPRPCPDLSLPLSHTLRFGFQPRSILYFQTSTSKGTLNQRAGHGLPARTRKPLPHRGFLITRGALWRFWFAHAD